MLKKLFLLGWAACGLTVSGRAELKLAAVFSDRMVLQRDTNAPVWGLADAGATVSVSFNGVTVSGTAGADGQWSAQLPALAADSQGRTLTVSDGKTSLSISEVLVGEVWLCAGQSNMVMSVAQSRDGGKVAAAADDALLRLLVVPDVIATRPASTFDAAWQVGSPASVGKFSAAGYFFGRELRERLGVPVGLVQAAWGGTPIASWMRVDLLRENPEDAGLLREREAWIFPDPADDEAYRQRGLREQEEWREKIERLLFSGGAPDAELFRAGLTLGEPWRSCALPGNIEKNLGVNTDGSFLLRREFTVSADPNLRHPATLRLGGLSDSDLVWVNGQLVGATFTHHGPQPPQTRGYTLPAGTLRAGANTIVIRLINRWNACCLGLDRYGQNVPDADLAVSVSGGQTVALAGEWQARVERDLGRYQRNFYDIRERAAGVMFDSKIVPLLPFALRGVIWYQGEHNIGQHEPYRRWFPLLVSDWRRLWGRELPVYFAQLTAFGERQPRPSDGGWPRFRETQSFNATETPNTGMAVIIDLGDERDIHPRDKREVGRRLALLALAKTYGLPVSDSGPVWSGMTIDGGRVTLTFSHADGGLVNRRADGEPRGFALAGADKKFYWARAAVSGSAVILSASEVPAPVAARYAWADTPDVDLFNADGLPTAPFRTDDWEWEK